MHAPTTHVRQPSQDLHHPQQFRREYSGRLLASALVGRMCALAAPVGLGLDAARPVGRRPRTGRGDLPKRVFVYSYAPHRGPRIHGAVLVDSVRRLLERESLEELAQLPALRLGSRREACVLVLSEAAAFPSARELPSDIRLPMRWGAPIVWKLPVDFEAALRAELGLRSDAPMVAWRTRSESFAQEISAGRVRDWFVPLGFCAAAGITAPGPNLEPIAMPASVATEEVALSAPVVVERACVAPGGPATPKIGGRWSLETVRDRVRHGFIQHRYSAKTLLLAVRVSRYLRSQSVELSTVASLVAQMILPEREGIQVAQALADRRKAPLPGREVVRIAQVKLDLAVMQFMREVSAKYRHSRYLYSDASPQFQWDFYAMREDRLVLPTQGVISAVDVAGLVQRSLPVSVLGYGHSKLAKKAYNTMHALMLESGSEFEKVRFEIRGFTTDQGTEHGLANFPFIGGDVAETLRRVKTGELNLADGAGVSAYLFPLALYCPEHLHVFYNALQNSITRLSEWRAMERMLRALHAFLKPKGMRDRFVETCMRGAPRRARLQFKHYGGAQVDWKWEYLTKLLDPVLRVWPLLVRYFDKSAIRAGARNMKEIGAVSPAALDDVEALVRGKPQLTHMCLLLLRCIAKACDLSSHWLEGCRCHVGILTSGGSRATRKRRLGAEAGIASCPWAGRRGCELSLGEAAALTDRICGASCAEYQELLSNVAPAVVYVCGLRRSGVVGCLFVGTSGFGAAPWPHLASEDQKTQGHEHIQSRERNLV